MSSISSLGGSNGSAVLSTNSSSFGDNAFLQLLIAQLRNQTPLEPVDNGSFMQQVATFSSMEEQRQLNDNMLKLLDYQGVLARLQGLSEGTALLGKQVSYLSGGKEHEGIVDAVFVTAEGDVRLKIGDQEIGMRQVTGIAQPKTQSTNNSDPANKTETNESKK